MPDDAGTGAKTIQSLQDLASDETNANLGTDRGQWALRESLIRFGVGRGVLADTLSRSNRLDDQHERAFEHG